MANLAEIFEGEVDLDPQEEPGQATLGLPAGAGVGLFTNGANQPILLLYGANIREIARRRLAEEPQPEKTRRTRLRPITAHVWFSRAWSPFDTQLKYFYAARKLYPENWREYFPRMEAWFIRREETGAGPRLTLVNRLVDPTTCWGPFAEKKSAGRILDALEGGFNLCRCLQANGAPGDPASCPYAQMGRCGWAAAADKNNYHTNVEEAAGFLDDPAGGIGRLEQQMREWASRKEYEQAGRIKQRVADLKTISEGSLTWVGPMADFIVLALQPGPPMKLTGQRAHDRGVSPFIITPRGITPVESFALSQASDACQGLLDHLRLGEMQRELALAGLVEEELLAWVCQFLYRQKQDRGLYIRNPGRETAASLAERITEHFSKSSAGSNKPQLDEYSLSEGE